MKKIFIVTALINIAILQPFFGNHSLAKQKGKYKSNSGILNPHYTGKHCDECHEKTPVKGGDLSLKYGGDYEKLCKCHGSSAQNYVHPVGIKPTQGKAVRIPADFTLLDGKLYCGTCHDIYLQCQKKPKKTRKTRKTYSIRGAPYEKRTDFCYKCHNLESYQMKNVHDHLDENGDVIAAKCRYCHGKVPEIEQTGMANTKLINELAVICQGCHAISGNHSGNYNHLIKPSEKALKIFKNIEINFNTTLPLGKEGKMNCVTCHNPHEKGLFPEEWPAARGADSKSRHRLPDICHKCHKL
jgi:hypothetical protein